MKPIIEFIDKNYSSDSINNGRNGRIVKRFFKQLCLNVFNNTLKHNEKHHEFVGIGEIPLLHSERNIYSLFSASINKITPIHLSEWGFNKNDSETLEKNRRVDYWCMYKERNLSKPINLYIELKSGWYSLNKRSKVNINKQVSDSIGSLIKQLRELRQHQPNFNNNDDVYLGIFIVCGYYFDKEEQYTSKDLHEEFYNVIDKRTIKHHLISTWTLPDDIPIQWEKKKCRFISIIGLPICL